MADAYDYNIDSGRWMLTRGGGRNNRKLLYYDDGESDIADYDSGVDDKEEQRGMMTRRRQDYSEWEDKTPSWDVMETAPNMGGDFLYMTEVNADDAVVNVTVTSTPNETSTVDTTSDE